MSRFYTDVNNPLFGAVECEYRRWLCEQYGPARVRDVRERHEAWDFEVTFDGVVFRVDVKCDRWMHASRRVPFEQGHLYGDGRWVDGWGRDGRLHYLAFVSPVSGEGVMTYRADLAAYVEDRLWHATEGMGGAASPVGWRRIDHPDEDRGRRTQGWAVPIEELRAAGVVSDEWSLCVSVAG